MNSLKKKLYALFCATAVSNNRNTFKENMKTELDHMAMHPNENVNKKKCNISSVTTTTLSSATLKANKNTFAHTYERAKMKKTGFAANFATTTLAS